MSSVAGGRVWISIPFGTDGFKFSSIMTTAGSGSAPSKSPESEVGLGSDTSVAGGEGKESETGVSVTLTSLSGDIESSSVPSDVSLASLKSQAEKYHSLMSAYKGFYTC